MTPHRKLTAHSWPFVGSCAVHSLLFVILILPAMINPAPYSTNALTVFWLPLDMSPNVSSEPSPTLHPKFQSDAGQHEPVGTPAPPVDQERIIVSSPALPTSAAAPDETADSVFTITKVALPKPAPPRKTQESLPATRSSSSFPQPTTAQHPAAPLEPEAVSQQTALPTLQPAKLDLPFSGQNVESKTTADRQNEPVTMTHQPTTQKQRHVVTTQKEQLLQGKKQHYQQTKRVTPVNAEPQVLTSSSKMPVRAVTIPMLQSGNKKPIESTPEKPRETAPPIIKGDVKLVAEGSTQIVATITFKEFAQTRRDRPFSRSEAKQEKPVTSKTTADDNKVEVVIEQSRPGVYTFTAEPVQAPVDVVFSLKLHDGTSQKIIKDLGRKALSSKTVLCKLLMPEGILWTDDQEFNGNMEDAESITKFITSTGLMWKEYTD